ESDASIQSALSGPGRPCIVFTRPVVLESENPATRLSENHAAWVAISQPPSAMLHVVSPAPCVDSSVEF
ncbi:hypothetical protein NDU88_003778, partial [Pleurodeles waltl]